ncbi:MAG: EutN/CcmL family microcompartment protein [Synergistaceae bacterium]|jgi:ethanolamine utilization protein EutN|nr:EutN/CcmL family microcompartment protein [Synergistaceae bacterium]
MRVAKVIGNIWATRKEPKLASLKMLLLQPINIASGSSDGVPIVATDMIGAGVGETVIFVTGSSARSATGDRSNPVDASVIAIVDDHEVDESVI